MTASPAEPSTVGAAETALEFEGGGRELPVIDAFVDLADSLIAEYDPLDFLYRLLDHSIPLTRAAAGAVLLHYEGRLHLVASSNEGAETVEVFEVQNSEGPAHDAFVDGQLILIPDISAQARRWPQFARSAERFGWASAMAIPLRLRDQVVGAFVCFWAADAGTLPKPSDEKLLRAFADVATIAILQQRRASALEVLNDQMHFALENRIKIEQAKGMVAQAANIGPGEAFNVIRQFARSKNKRIPQVAEAVLDATLDIHTLSGGRSDWRGPSNPD